MTEVAIVGAGPTGLMVAGELALAGIEVAILERRTTTELIGTRARGFHSRTIEILDQRGIADRFLAEGQAVQALSLAGVRLDLSGFPSRHPYTLGLEQSHIERILLGWVEELGVPIRRGMEVTGLTQDDTGVEVHLAGGATLRTAYLIGADGGRSAVRRAAGIAFVGPEPTRSQLIAEVEVTQETPTGIRLDEVGIHAMSVVDGGRVGVVVTERQIGPATEPTLAELRAALRAAYGTDFGAHAPRWISRFTDAVRQAAAYRSDRVLIAGDAAHVHPPVGGQGIGLGVQDAVNLGWKLAQVVRGASPASLLDSYHAERHPATARVLRNVTTQALLQRGDPRTEAVNGTIADLLDFEGPRVRLAGLLSGLDVHHDPGHHDPGHHDPGTDHLLLGRRMPDLDLVTADGPRRVFELLHAARPVLLDLGEPVGIDVTAGADRVRYVAARHADPDRAVTWELPVVGTVTAPTAVLIRPDGHVAWVGEGTWTGLATALATWCGHPAREASGG